MIDFKYLKKPELYEKGTHSLWNDEHISKGMLDAHLNPNFEAASRKHDFIDESVKWINSITPSTKYNKVLDLGCGPGLYCDRLYDLDYDVTGIDYSKRSINYAKQQTNIKGKDVNYIYKNYLEIDYNNEFDLITLIYCDYGTFDSENRKVLLNKVYHSLKKGGRFIFDVFTLKNYEDRKEENKWFISDGGFWSPNEHLCLESHHIYENNIRLDQYVVLEEDNNVKVIRNWFKAFTKDSILEELKEVGFNNIKVYKNLIGEDYKEDSKTICLVAEKY